MAYPTLTRRAALGAMAATAGSVCLAACGGGSDAAAPATESSSGSAGASAEPSATSSASAADDSAGGEQVVALADVPVGGAVSATIGGKPVVVSQPTKGEVKAFSAVCPHQGGIVAPDGDEFVCPLHRSRFKVGDGSVINGPARTGLKAVTVKVDGTEVVTG